MYTIANLANPRSFIDEFFREVERASSTAPVFQPAADVVEVDGGWRVRLELPGVAREAVKVEVKENLLTVSGDKPDPYAEARTYRRAETGYGAFSRTFRLSQAIDRERIEAKFENGVLEVSLWPRPEVGSRSIEIR
jgi:HSP20 family protein